MATTIHLILLGLVWIAVFASACLWVRFLIRCLLSEARFSDLVPAQRRTKPFWTLADFFVMFFTLVGGLLIFSSIFVTEEWVEPVTKAGVPSLHRLVGNIIANGFAGIVAVAVSCAWMCVIFEPKSMVDLGMIPNWSDVKLGLCAALWILPPIGLISLLVSLAVPYEHPVLDTLAESPTPLLFALMFLGTAIVAPVVEEFMFRVLLQGSLERVATSLASSPIPVDDAGKTDTLGTLQEKSTDPENENVHADPPWAPRFYWPLVLTSFIFAMMHLGQGAAPIPLFALSMALGYLYRQTGRITAPLVVHMVLNATTLMVEFSRIVSESG